MIDSNNYSARSIMRTLGTGEVEATFALQQGIQLQPRTSDPDAGATVIVIKAVQRGLKQLGCPLQVTGRIDPETEACLTKISGPNWESRDWLSITKDIIVMRDSGLKLPPTTTFQEVGDVSFGAQAGGLLLLGAVALLAWKLG